MTNTISIADSGLSKTQKNPTIETDVVRNVSSIVDKDSDISHYYVVCKARELSKFSKWNTPESNPAIATVEMWRLQRYARK